MSNWLLMAMAVGTDDAGIAKQDSQDNTEKSLRK
jgi:hypothetical protein